MSAILTIESVSELRNNVTALKRKGKRIGFVPTMGYLHRGHLSLVELSRRESDYTAVSIFVNPSQFNNPEDLLKYPRDIPRDIAMLETVGVDVVFLPTPQIMYGPQHESWVDVSNLGKNFEGAHRPGHFRGVSTVVSMLFNLVQPDCAVFGEKDFQQLRLIERMVEDLKFPIEILRGPLVREEDGLAMSSRNVRLDATSRVRALSISRGLFAAQAAFQRGQKNSAKLSAVVRESLDKEVDVITEYVEVVREDNLDAVEIVSMPCRIIVAASVDGVRLIDNIALGG